MFQRLRPPHVGALALIMCLAGATANVGAVDANLAAANPATAVPAAPAGAQSVNVDQRPVHWEVQIVPGQAKAGDDAEVVFRANVAPGWIFYSTDFKLEIGPRPARFTFEPNPGVTLVGSVRPIGASRRKDRSLGGEYTYFAGRAEFRQSVHLVGSSPASNGPASDGHAGSGPASDAPFRSGLTSNAPAAAAELAPNGPTLTGHIDGQACFEQSGLCELLRENFTVAL